MSPTSDMDYSERAAGSFRALAQAKMLERRVSRPGTPTSSASTDTPNSEQNDMDEDMIDVDEEPSVDSEFSHSQLKRPFQLLIAAAMERNPTQFQLPNELTCTTALPGQCGSPLLCMCNHIHILYGELIAVRSHAPSVDFSCATYFHLYCRYQQASEERRNDREKC